MGPGDFSYLARALRAGKIFIQNFRAIAPLQRKAGRHIILSNNG
jgi:hypothetical protein